MFILGFEYISYSFSSYIELHCSENVALLSFIEIVKGDNVS